MVDSEWRATDKRFNRPDERSASAIPSGVIFDVAILPSRTSADTQTIQSATEYLPLDRVEGKNLV